jgi:hypothetical protein
MRFNPLINLKLSTEDQFEGLMGHSRRNALVLLPQVFGKLKMLNMAAMPRLIHFLTCAFIFWVKTMLKLQLASAEKKAP